MVSTDTKQQLLLSKFISEFVNASSSTKIYVTIIGNATSVIMSSSVGDIGLSDVPFGSARWFVNGLDMLKGSGIADVVDVKGYDSEGFQVNVPLKVFTGLLEIEVLKARCSFILYKFYRS